MDLEKQSKAPHALDPDPTEGLQVAPLLLEPEAWQVHPDVAEVLADLK